VKPADVRKQIQAGSPGPLYLLEGEDLQSRNELAVEFGAVVDEGLHPFNVQNFHASEGTTAAARDQLIGSLLAAARTLPMMAPRRVLTVYQAERLLSPRKSKDDEAEPPAPPADSGKKRKRTFTAVEELEEYLETPEPSTTLVFVAGPMDANRRLVKLVRRTAVVVDCGTVESPAEAARWIKARLEKDRLGIEPAAIAELLETTGLNLGRIRAEVEKLALFAIGEPAVTVRHVREMMQPQLKPGENFPMGTAIWSRNAKLALDEIAAQLDAGSQPVMILGQIRAAVRSLRSDDQRIKEGLDAVFTTDLAIKGAAGGDPRHHLERLVIGLCAR
jgi:DNA polymerase III subunit delta